MSVATYTCKLLASKLVRFEAFGTLDGIDYTAFVDVENSPAGLEVGRRVMRVSARNRGFADCVEDASNAWPVQRVDWFRVLCDIKHSGGLSLKAIAASVGVSKSRIISWKNIDAEPRHEDGERLIVLWEHITLKKRDQLPRQQ